MDGLTVMAKLVESLRAFGFFDFYLPFFIMFAVFWGVLTKIKLFGPPEEKLARNVNLIVSLGASLYILASTELGFEFANFLSILFGSTFMILFTIIAFTAVLFVVYAVVTGKDAITEGSERWKLIAILTLVAAILYALSAASSSLGVNLLSGITFPGLNLDLNQLLWSPPVGISGEDVLIFLMIVVTILAILFVVQGENNTNPAGN